MSVNLNVSNFSADFFTLDQENKPTDTAQFLKGLDALALRALDALSKPEDVELAFRRIKNASLVQLSPQDKTKVTQRIQDVFNSWVKVIFGNHFRHVPRERLEKQCGPKFKAQYTSQMKEATDRELYLQSTDESPTARRPGGCKEPLLVYLQTGTLPLEALEDNALDILLLAEQHEIEGLIQACLDFLVDNLSRENLGTTLEFTQQTHYPQLELACLNFMKINRDSISDDLKTKYQEQFSMVEALERGEITLTISSSRKIEAIVGTFTEQTADVLQKINKRFQIVSLILPTKTRKNLFSLLEQIAPTLKSLQELVIWNEIPSDRVLRKLINLFPNLKALGNDAPFLKTFDEVKTYLKNFRKPGADDQGSKKLHLHSLNLKAVSNLTDAQFAELTPYLQGLYHLSIKSDKINSVVAPKVTTFNCKGCTALTTLKAPNATRVDCSSCARLTTLEVPETISVDCNGCTKLTALEAPQATRVNCDGCTKLTTLQAPKATRVDCDDCTALTTLEAPEATSVYCNGCTKLTTLQAPKATTVVCTRCTALTTLEAPKATRVICRGCTQLTTLVMPEAVEANYYGCTLLTTIEAPEATWPDDSGFTKLTTLKAPKTTKGDSYGCTQLTSLEAPKSTPVNCYGRTALTTLVAPNATSVDCSGCTQLTTVEAPKATKINCNGCTKLTTLLVRLKQPRSIAAAAQHLQPLKHL